MIIVFISFLEIPQWDPQNSAIETLFHIEDDTEQQRFRKAVLFQPFLADAKLQKLIFFKDDFTQIRQKPEHVLPTVI